MDRLPCTCTLLFFLLLSHYVAGNAEENEVENEIPFTYGHEEKGPENWGNLNPKWKTSANGRLQSPIDLSDERVEIVPKLGNFKRNYKPAPAVIRNRGHDIQVACEGDAGDAVLNGTEYKLLQCHWHSPSEHTLNGKRYELEIHLVHNNSLGQLAVVGIVYKLGHPDPFLSKLIETIKKSENQEESHVGLLILGTSSSEVESITDTSALSQFPHARKAFYGQL